MIRQVGPVEPCDDRSGVIELELAGDIVANFRRSRRR
jgi:hypothetical protein